MILKKIYIYTYIKGKNNPYSTTSTERWNAVCDISLSYIDHYWWLFSICIVWFITILYDLKVVNTRMIKENF